MPESGRLSDFPTYYKKSKGVIVADDKDALREYYERKRKNIQERKRKDYKINNLEERVEHVEESLDDIKDMLQQLLNNKDNG